jgi:hypothetical protein
MSKSVRRDVFWQQIRSGYWRMAFCVLFLPDGYILSKRTVVREDSDEG